MTNELDRLIKLAGIHLAQDNDNIISLNENLSPIHGAPENPDEDLYPDQTVHQHDHDWNDPKTSEVTGPDDHHLDEMEEIDELDPEDGFIEDSRLGGYNASLFSKHIGRFDDYDEAIQAIRDEAGPNYFPNIWFIDDHGGQRLITDEEMDEGVIGGAVKGALKGAAKGAMMTRTPQGAGVGAAIGGAAGAYEAYKASQENPNEAREVPDAVINNFEYDPDAEPTEIEFDTDKPMQEDFGSSDWTPVIAVIDASIAKNGLSPEVVETAADEAAHFYGENMGYDDHEEAVDAIIQMWTRRSETGRKLAAMFADPVEEGAPLGHPKTGYWDPEMIKKNMQQNKKPKNHKNDVEVEESENGEYDYGHQHMGYKDYATDVFDYKGRAETSGSKLRRVNNYGDNPLIAEEDPSMNSSIRGKRFYENQDPTDVRESEYRKELRTFLDENEKKDQK